MAGVRGVFPVQFHANKENRKRVQSVRNRLFRSIRFRTICRQPENERRRRSISENSAPPPHAPFNTNIVRFKIGYRRVWGYLSDFRKK